MGRRWKARNRAIRRAPGGKPKCHSSIGGLVMARAQKRLAADKGDADLLAHAIDLERDALEAIRLGLSALSEERKPVE
jgi:hypothetical protein